MSGDMKWVDSRQRKPSSPGWYWFTFCGNPDTIQAAGWSEVRHPWGKTELLAPKSMHEGDAAFYMWYGPVEGPPDIRELSNLIAPAKGALSLPISRLDLSVRASNALEGEGISTVGDLVSKTEEELTRITNFGRTSLREVEKKLGELGVSLKANQS